jgi:hypothetical protein
MSIFGTRISGFFSGGTSGGGGGGTVVGVTGTLPISSSGGTTPDISISQASGSTNGYLSSGDWTTFNNKVGGSGTTNFMPKWSGTGTITNGLMFDNGTSVGLGTTTPSASFKFDVVGSIRASAFGFFGSDQVRINTSTSGYVELYDGSEKKMLVGNGATNLANFTAFNGNTFSFNNEGNYIPSRLVGFNSQLFKSAGTDTHNVIEVNPEIQVSGGTTTLRGFYYNPNLTIQTGLTNIAWQNVSGNIIFGNFGGSSLTNRLLVMDINGKLDQQPNALAFTLYSGSSIDFADCNTNASYKFGDLINGHYLNFDVGNTTFGLWYNGQPNGVTGSTTTPTYKIGYVTTSSLGGSPTYFEISGANNKIQVWDNAGGNYNGLYMDITNQDYYFGDYLAGTNGSHVQCLKTTNYLQLTNGDYVNGNGGIIFNAGTLQFNGSFIEDNTFVPSSTPTYLVIILNSTTYYIPCQT